jgi:K+-sensing histidine kinase KdpD
MGAHRAVVAGALASIERAGCAGWGQAGASRRPGRAIARVARERGARHVVIVVPARPRWRRVMDGEFIRELSRRVAAGTTIETVSP